MTVHTTVTMAIKASTLHFLLHVPLTPVSKDVQNSYRQRLKLQIIHILIQSCCCVFCCGILLFYTFALVVLAGKLLYLRFLQMTGNVLS